MCEGKEGRKVRWRERGEMEWEGEGRNGVGGTRGEMGRV
jgi:hypothetical protein